MARKYSNTGWQQAVADVATHTEAEIRRALAYLNDEVVPEVRRDGSHVLRAASRELNRWADHLESRHKAAERTDDSATQASHSARPAWSTASR